MRSLRSPAKESRERRPAFVLCRTIADREVICNNQMEIESLANLSSLMVINEKDDVPTNCGVSVVNEKVTVYLKLEGSHCAEIDLEKIRKKIDNINLQQEKLLKLISVAGYEEKVPEKIQQVNADKFESLRKEMLSLREVGQHIESSNRCE